MKQALVATIAALLLAVAWQHGLAGKPDSRAKSEKRVENRQTASDLADCDRSLTGTIIDSRISVQRLLDMEVVNPLGEDIGWIADLILDPSGSITHVIVYIGGFLGVGGDQVAVPVDKIRIRSRGPSSSTRVALVRETREHMLSGYEEYSRDQAVK